MSQRIDELLEKLGARPRLLEQAARLLRDHVAGENVDDLMHQWADDWDAETGESYRECEGVPGRCMRTSKYDRHLLCNNELPCSNPDHVPRPASQPIKAEKP